MLRHGRSVAKQPPRRTNGQERRYKRCVTALRVAKIRRRANASGKVRRCAMQQMRVATQRYGKAEAHAGALYVMPRSRYAHASGAMPLCRRRRVRLPPCRHATRRVTTRHASYDVASSHAAVEEERWPLRVMRAAAA